ncbi:MAG: AAA family ATPase [Treponema sp.]|nr:AAA family ATPase [Treponema sp.]
MKNFFEQAHPACGRTGIQDFEGIRENGFIYVDKTACVHRLSVEGKPCFLSRSRGPGIGLGANLRPLEER